MYQNLWYGYEDTPYKKRNKQSTPKKANHKHEYHKCLIRAKDSNWSFEKQWHRSEYCIHCGRIKSIIFWQTITSEELNTLPKFEVNDIWKDKFVSLQTKK